MEKFNISTFGLVTLCIFLWLTGLVTLCILLFFFFRLYSVHITLQLANVATVVRLPEPAGRENKVEAETIDAKIDIIVIMEQGNRSIEAAAYKKFGTYFEFGQDKTRFAIVRHVSVEGFDPDSFNKHHPNILNMTADQNLYEQKLDYFRDPWNVDRYPDPPFFYGDGEFFVHARNQFAGYSGSGRGKALFHIVQYYLPNRGSKQYVQRAKELAGTGVWLYTFVQNYTGGKYTANKDDFNRTAQFTEPKRHFSWRGNYTIRLSDQMVKVKDAVLRDICEWDAACTYKESNRAQCTWDSWLVHPYTNNPKQCDPFKPKAAECSHDDCLTECNRRWHWEKLPNCAGKCGERVDGIREGYPPKYMEHCPVSIECPPCPSASTRLDAISSKSTQHGATPQSSSTGLVVDISFDAVPIGLIIGAAVGGLIFLSLLVLIVVCATKKKKKPVPSKVVVKAAAVSRGPPKTVPMKKSADTRKEPAGKEAMVEMRMKGGQAAIAADISTTHKSSLATGAGKSTKLDTKGVQPMVEASKKKEPTSKMETGKLKGPTSKMETSTVKAPASKRVPTTKRK